MRLGLRASRGRGLAAHGKPAPWVARLLFSGGHHEIPVDPLENHLPTFHLSALVMLAALLSALGANHVRAEEVLVDGIAAQVGGEIVLLSEVLELARPVEERMREARVPEEQIRSMHADALERLIETKLIQSVVRRLELEATPGEIDSAIEGIAADTGLTVEQMQRSIESHGLTIREYREKLKDEIEKSKVLNAMVRSRVRVDPEEIQDLFQERYGFQPESGGDEVRMRHIVVAIGPEFGRGAGTACQIAESARQRIVSGEISFGEMARRVTDMNPEQAGELGWLPTDDLAGWMRGPAMNLSLGEVSGAIETPFGCNLLQVVERREYRPVELADVEMELTQELSNQKMERAYMSWLETLRKQTYISRKGLYSESTRIEQITGGRGAKQTP